MCVCVCDSDAVYIEKDQTPGGWYTQGEGSDWCENGDWCEGREWCDCANLNTHVFVSGGGDVVGEVAARSWGVGDLRVCTQQFEMVGLQHGEQTVSL